MLEVDLVARGRWVGLGWQCTPISALQLFETVSLSNRLSYNVPVREIVGGDEQT